MVTHTYFDTTKSGVGLDDPYGSLPIWDILWVHDSKSFNDQKSQSTKLHLLVCFHFLIVLQQTEPPSTCNFWEMTEWVRKLNSLQDFFGCFERENNPMWIFVLCTCFGLSYCDRCEQFDMNEVWWTACCTVTSEGSHQERTGSGTCFLHTFLLSHKALQISPKSRAPSNRWKEQSSFQATDYPGGMVAFQTFMFEKCISAKALHFPSITSCSWDTRNEILNAASKTKKETSL